ncbi:MAG: FeoB-associated Cys-rich membrane protein [Clostridiales bacterium]|nr:FeoB-associated Cys-rich membrane protein [Clostridiales bacterium]
MLAQVLNVVLPAVVFGYGLYLLIRMLRGRARGCGCGGCSGCPMAHSCAELSHMKRKEDTHDD